MFKKKIINDPLYGFVPIVSELILELINHPYLQRLRHIRQLGVSDMVYPGATHSRFHHALGSMCLMGKVLDSLREKGVEISHQEYEAAQIAMLLHDIGHGPLSHTLEETLLKNVNHENLTILFLKFINRRFHGALDLVIEIFCDTYHRKFFHMLVSSQLDVDRLDYLRRDSYFTGVPEGTFGVDRIIAMMGVVDDQLVIEEKGLYSVESFLQARRYMYWQVYLHKTAISVERMLTNIFRRVQHLASTGKMVSCSDALRFFITHHYSLEDFIGNSSLLEKFVCLDDHDVWSAIKNWSSQDDIPLSLLCTRVMQRSIFQIKMTTSPTPVEWVKKLRDKLSTHYGISQPEASYLYSKGSVTNAAYIGKGKTIYLRTKSGKIVDISKASEPPSIKVMSKIVKKNFICWPKEISLHKI